MDVLARQVLVEYYGCSQILLNDLAQVREIMMEAVRRSGAHIVTDVFHLFAPQGISGVIVIAESHVSIHTWPEFGYAAVDIFTCGMHVDPWTIQSYIADHFKSTSVSTVELQRGLFPHSVKHISPP